MFTFFLTPLADENLYSIVIRHYKISGYKSFQEFIRCFLCGHHFSDLNRKVFPIYGLLPYYPRSDGYERRIFDALSLSPYFWPFLSGYHIEKFNECFEAGSNKNKRNLCKFLTVINSQYNTIAQFCTECVEEQLVELPYSFWLRSHQLPHVKLCWKHCIRLTRVGFCKEDSYLPHEVSNLLRPAIAGLNVDSWERKDNLWIAKNSKNLLEWDSDPLDINELKSLFKLRAKAMGFDLLSELSIQQLITYLTATWSRRELWGMQEELGGRRGFQFKIQNLLHHVLSGSEYTIPSPRFVPPIIYLMLIRFLFGDMQSFAEAVEKFSMSPENVRWKNSFRRDEGITKRPSAQDDLMHAVNYYRGKLLAYLEDAATPDRAYFVRKELEAYKWLAENDRRWLNDQFRNHPKMRTI